MDDGEEKGPAMGARPKALKVPNPRNQPRREREARQKLEHDGALIQGQAQQGQVVQEQVERAEPEQVEAEQVHDSKIPSFGDGSALVVDWTTSRLFGDPIKQDKDTCGATVFTALLQASHNRGKPEDQHLALSYKDLANYIRDQTKKKKFSFRNMNIPIRHIRDVGVHKDDKISGPGVKGLKTKGEFDFTRDATKQTVYDLVETTPFGIVLPDYPKLHALEKEIYKVPGGRNDDLGEHALLIVAKGRTRDGVEFLVAQNSWGVEYGNNGYCRISLPEDRGFDIFWPLSW